MKKLALISSALCAIILCSACNTAETIDAINPVVQTAKMQNSAKQVTDEVTQIHNQAIEAQRKELENITLE